MEWQGLPIKELLEGLPQWAAVAVTIALIFIGYRGTAGRSHKADDPLFDNSALFRLASAIERHNLLTEQGHDNLRHAIEAFNRHAEEVRELTREIRESVTSLLRHRV